MASMGEMSCNSESSEPSWRVAPQVNWRKPSSLLSLARARLVSFRSRFCLEEASGALGDLGTLIPLLAACAQARSVRLGPAMFWMGVFNIISGIQWDIPMPVQPMKSIAAVAISDGMDPGAFAAAGMLTGSIVWILGVTQTIEVANKLIPKCVIAGLQVGLGIKMAAKGCSYWHINQWVDDLDGKLTALLCLVLALLLMMRTKLPTALIIFTIGVVITVARMYDEAAEFRTGFLQIPVIVPSRQEWLDGFVSGALPQLPLTTLNSVVSVCALSVDLFGDPEAGGKGVIRVSVATSVGFMNVVGCWFGAMPSCHGAGGLAGQFRFGARGGCAVVMLGAVKVVLALTIGETLDTVVASFPKVVLGVLLLFAGVELASVGTKVILKSPSLEDDLLPCFITAGAYIGTKNMALGVIAGLISAGVQRLDVCRQALAFRSKTPGEKEERSSS